MGLDVSFGLMYGCKLKDICTLSKKTEQIELFNEYTGIKTGKKHTKYIEKYILKTDFLKFKKDEVIDSEEFEEEILLWGEDDNNKVMSQDFEFIGYDLNSHMPFSESPQDICIEYNENDSSIDKWNKDFPDIPGKRYIYLTASY